MRSAGHAEPARPWRSAISLSEKRIAEKLFKDSPNSKLYPCNVENDEERCAGKSPTADYGTIDGLVQVAFAPAPH